MIVQCGKKQYCYSYTRINGKVRRVYLGGNQTVLDAERARQEQQRQLREQQVGARRANQRHAELKASLAAFDNLLDLAVKATLMGLGFHQHARGQWRLKRHGCQQQDGIPGGATTDHRSGE